MERERPDIEHQDTQETTQMPEIEGLPTVELPLPDEGVIYEFRTPTNGMKANQVRHTLNLSVFTGHYHGKYYYRGVVQHPKEKDA